MSTVITAAGAPAAVGPYSHALQVGNLLFCSGQIPLVPETGVLAEGGIVGQTKQMFANVRAVLAAAGMDFSNVVKVTVFMTNLQDFSTLNEIYATYFPENPPARSCVEVAALPKGALVEMEIIAAQ